MSAASGHPKQALTAGRQAEGIPVTENTLRIQLDGQPYTVPLHSTVATLVAALGHAPEAVGTAVNGGFVARAARADHSLRDGDAVVLFQPIVGG